ncbi:spermidine synthase [Planctomycetota bacterium]
MSKHKYSLLAILLLSSICAAADKVVFEVTSPYHHIKVADYDRKRILHFDASTQSRMSLDNPLEGHFEYTEYFHMPWLWNDKIENVLMIGLGGSSIQRAYQAYYPDVNVTTVELDPKVVEVAKNYFHFQETEKMKVIVGDGRMHLRRTDLTYDVIILDAYTANRYGSYIPYTLATKEFFALAREHLSENGVLAYNVIGVVSQRKKNLVGSIYRTLKDCFPQVVLFPAVSSYNVVIIATRSPEVMTGVQFDQRIKTLLETEKVTLPNFRRRAKRLRRTPPASAKNSLILVDDFAPVDGLLKTE